MSTGTDTAIRALQAAGDERTHGRRMGKKPLNVSHIILHIILAVGALIMAGPFIWMLLSSLKPLSEIFQQPPSLLPNDWRFDNYARAWEGADFARGFFNSFYIATTVTVVSVLTSAMAGYAFARIKFFGRSGLFMTFLATMMVPMQLTIIPLYIIMGSIGWVDTHLSLIVPPAMFNAFGVFLMRQYVRGIPKELDEAAEIDGASRLRIFVTIILPILRTPMAALGIFTFLSQWNNFFYPLIFLNSPEKFTLPLVVNQFKGEYASDWTSLMSACTMAAAPLLILFIFAQRQIVEGVALSGSKG
ncbi:carbohydrate ABC transporter permease [Streptomyces sioyaensis]|uniref:carbohydrate ABC transporter permease n=1 Tax=Streptomyces sioyaensis TaxID=67364 RepID=UPI0033C10742